MREQYYISSTKVSLRERKLRGGKVYDAVFRVLTANGEERQKRLCGFSTKALAKQAHAKFITEKCELVKNNPLKKKAAADEKKATATLNDLYPAYIQSLRNQTKESTLYDEANVLRRQILPCLGDYTPKELTRELLYKWQDELWGKRNPKTGKFYSYRYLTNIRGYLSAFLSWIADRYDAPNNLRNVRKPKRRNASTAMKFWTRSEFDNFLAVVDNPTYRAVFATLFFTGRRKGEVLALSPADVAADAIVFDKTYSRKTIDGAPYKITSTKNERRNKTIICEPLRRELAKYTPQSPFYFGGDNPIHENTIAHAFERYIERAGLPKIRLHDLRHSFVSMCIHLGASVYVVADLIGDTVEQILKTYGHLYEDDKKAIIEKIK